ncbi:MAG TPA: double-strand break repair helicase AddA [Stellaceae bacterium]|nr:double-strand break repair helicase AddA [Stellaceae bacterium]
MTDPAAQAGERQRRASDGAFSVWVAASAGTGKTKVLTDRVLNLLLGGSPPERILCLTFTKAAAAEMAIRINERLARWATAEEGALAQDLVALTGALPDAALLRHARRLFARVLDTPGGLKIATIHAFCQSLLRRFPIEAGVAPHFEVLDERNADELLGEAREAVLAAARAGAPGLADALAEATRYLPEEGFAELLAMLTLERARLARCGIDSIARFEARLHALLGVRPGATAGSILADAAAPGACDEAALRDAAAALLASGAVSDRNRGARIAAWLADPEGRVDGFPDYALAFLTSDGAIRDRHITKAAAVAAPGAAAVLLAEARRVAETFAARSACALLHASAAMARLADALLGAYAAKKALHAALDYDDLILKTRELLNAPGVAAWVLFKLDGGLDHILVDEAQDTNPEQWQVIAALAEEFFSGRGAREAHRTVFAVGDAKQSIYSFQRADPLEFLRMREHFAARVAAAADPPGDIRWRTVDLDISFRSTETVLRAVDAVFAQPEAAAGVALDGGAIHHAAQRLGHAGRVELWPAVAPDPVGELPAWQPPLEQQRVRAPATRLAEAIAARIRGWLDEGEMLPARGRRLRAGDVMVLVRRRGPFVGALVRALKQRRIAVAGADRMRLAEQLVVEDLTALGQFLLLPEDDLTLAAVLKGPLFAVTEEMLFTLAHGRGTRSLWSELRRRADEHPALRAAADALSELLARVDFAAPYELFAEILGARGGRRAILARLGAEAGDPLDEFLAQALAYERAHIPSLQGFLHWLQSGETEVKRDLDQRGRDEVRILTVHGAKGLQAPIVFLPDTMQVPKQTPRLLWARDGEGELPLWSARRELEAPAAEAARQEALRRREEEYRRLLYVAMTRAEDRLYVCGWQTRKAPPAGCWYNLVAKGLSGVAEKCAHDFSTLIGADGWSGPGLRLDSPQRVPAKDDNAAALDVRMAAELPDWVRRPPPPEPMPPKPLAPSRPDMAEPAARSPLDGENGARGAGFRRGLLVHRLLQMLPELPPPSRLAAAQQFLARPVHGLGEDEQRALAEETLAILGDPAFAPLFGPDSQAEAPVVGLFGGYALSGQIDRLVVGAREVLIVDYKTLRPPPAALAGVPPLYLRQLAAYRAAIATIYPAKSVRCALLWTDGPRLMEVPSELLDAAIAKGVGA